MGYEDSHWWQEMERKKKENAKYKNLQVACAFIRDAKFNHLLLSQRSANNAWGPGLWETPGGKVDRGESLEEACKREILEELGVDIKLEAKIVTLFNIPIPPANRSEEFPALRFDITAFLGTIDHNERDPAPLESDAIQWWTIPAIEGATEKSVTGVFVTAQPGLFPALMLYRKEVSATLSCPW